jgi:oligopeptide/dipeptide ABC transporter ATP-binding protein
MSARDKHLDGGRRLEIADLTVDYRRGNRFIRAVNGVSLDVDPGESLGIVGESGSGKSTLVMASVGLLDPSRSRIGATRLRFGDRDLTRGAGDVLGRHIGVIFQNPLAALNPLLTIERQLTDHMRFHLAIGQADASDRALQLLKEVGISDASRRLRAYPSEFSGGMLQRVTIAMALACDPELLIADEPTTALDATIQAEVLDLIADIRTRRRLALIWITHDLGLMSHIADRIAVMYAGRLVEVARRDDIYGRPRHPYTRALLDCAESLWDRRDGELRTIEGQPPRLGEPIAHCAFRSRCGRATAACAERPALGAIGGLGHQVACFNPVAVP